MKKSHLLLVFLCLSISCKDGPHCCFNIDLNVHLRVYSNEGIDLLNPENLNSYTNVSIFHDKDGKKQFYESIDLSELEPIRINEDSIRYSIPLNFFIPKNDISTIYLLWNDMEEDTIKSEIEKGSNFISSSKIWINDVLVWDIVNKPIPRKIFTLTKTR